MYLTQPVLSELPPEAQASGTSIIHNLRRLYPNLYPTGIS
jgi:hypothetical protein